MSVLTKDNALELLQSPQGLFPSSGVLMVFVLFNKIDEEPLIIRAIREIRVIRCSKQNLST